MTTHHIVRRAAAVTAVAASLMAVTGASAAAAAPALPMQLGAGSHCLAEPKAWALPLDLQSLACVGVLKSGS